MAATLLTCNQCGWKELFYSRMGAATPARPRRSRLSCAKKANFLEAHRGTDRTAAVKTLLTVLLLLACQMLHAKNDGIASLTVTNLQHGTIVDRLPGRDPNSNTKETTRVAAIRVKVSAFSKPTEPYEVQCFFFAKDPGRRRFIYDVQRFQSEQALADFAVYARDLFGGSQTVTQSTRYVTLTEVTTQGSVETKTVPVTDTQVSTTRGNNREGWVVRVLSNGRLARMTSSLAQLQQFAEKESALLDKLASEAQLQPMQSAP